MPNSNEPTRTYNDIPPLTAIELGGVIARVKEGEEIIGNVPLPVPVNKGGTNATTAPTARTNLGLGTLATQNANSVAITGGAISGITDLAVADGGTGTSNGSITGTGALTFAAGGTNQGINLNPSGTGLVTINAVEVRVNQPIQDTVGLGLSVNKGDGYFRAINSFSGANQFFPVFLGKTTVTNLPSLTFVGEQGPGDSSVFGTIWFSARNSAGDTGVAGSHKAFEFSNYITPLVIILGNGDSTFHSTTESTSTTTGALQIAGGLGVVKNVNIGGNLRVAGGTIPATATSAGTTGDIRYDGSHLYICTATNTWVRTVLSTW